MNPKLPNLKNGFWTWLIEEMKRMLGRKLELFSSVPSLYTLGLKKQEKHCRWALLYAKNKNKHSKEITITTWLMRYVILNFIHLTDRFQKLQKITTAIWSNAFRLWLIHLLAILRSKLIFNENIATDGLKLILQHFIL